MKKRLFALLLPGVLLLTACMDNRIGEAFDGAVNTRDDVTMTLVEGTASSTGAEVEILNTVDAEVFSGNESVFSLQVEQDGVWHVLEPDRTVAHTDEALIYPPGEPVAHKLVWSHAGYAPLPAGHYRVIRDFSQTTPDGYDTFLLAAEFTLQ